MVQEGAIKMKVTEKSKVIVIAGPTGSGKTEFSLMLAKDVDGEIINCDASQMKKDLNIGTAKIDLTKTNIKHYLIDFLAADENYSIRDFQTKAREVISTINSSKKVPIIVGGTGLYINALLYNYNLNDTGRDPDFEKKYNDISNHELHLLLEKENKELAKEIHENNRRRVLRALEKCQSNSNEVHFEKNTDMLYNAKIFCLCPKRCDLYERINLRVEKMLDAGWIDECKKLQASNYDISKIKDIGYHEIFEFLNGNLSENDMKEIIKQKTRNYAKRQITWFKNKLKCQWVEVDYNDISSAYKVIYEESKKFLEK